ncbi:hypothetical protein DesfrDRAFT_2379 [Solidesulfovibrio fructosivorans JJ]]|uniref:Uncharacterized protein n=1 Tax=Solidesulfovibrio fructosivorans JJ] TaxID=596151 RepID=E1JXN0_SOLFR|nr:hypothetical protein DesfrDRAFT_2379 [Solidesulfovibrio fructosivorans JJ]]
MASSHPGEIPLSEEVPAALALLHAYRSSGSDSTNRKSGSNSLERAIPSLWLGTSSWKRKLKANSSNPNRPPSSDSPFKPRPPKAMPIWQRSLSKPGAVLRPPSHRAARGPDSGHPLPPAARALSQLRHDKQGMRPRRAPHRLRPQVLSHGRGDGRHAQGLTPHHPGLLIPRPRRGHLAVISGGRVGPILDLTYPVNAYFSYY